MADPDCESKLIAMLADSEAPVDEQSSPCDFIVEAVAVISQICWSRSVRYDPAAPSQALLHGTPNVKKSQTSQTEAESSAQSAPWSPTLGSSLLVAKSRDPLWQETLFERLCMVVFTEGDISFRETTFEQLLLAVYTAHGVFLSRRTSTGSIAGNNFDTFLRLRSDLQTTFASDDLLQSLQNLDDKISLGISHSMMPEILRILSSVLLTTGAVMSSESYSSLLASPELVVRIRNLFDLAVTDNLLQPSREEMQCYYASSRSGSVEAELFRFAAVGWQIRLESNSRSDECSETAFLVITQVAITALLQLPKRGHSKKQNTYPLLFCKSLIHQIGSHAYKRWQKCWDMVLQVVRICASIYAEKERKNLALEIEMAMRSWCSYPPLEHSQQACLRTRVQADLDQTLSEYSFKLPPCNCPTALANAPPKTELVVVSEPGLEDYAFTSASVFRQDAMRRQQQEKMRELERQTDSGQLRQLGRRLINRLTPSKGKSSPGSSNSSRLSYHTKQKHNRKQTASPPALSYQDPRSPPPPPPRLRVDTTILEVVPDSRTSLTSSSDVHLSPRQVSAGDGEDSPLQHPAMTPTPDAEDHHGQPCPTSIEAQLPEERPLRVSGSGRTAPPGLQ